VDGARGHANSVVLDPGGDGFCHLLRARRGQRAYRRLPERPGTIAYQRGIGGDGKLGGLGAGQRGLGLDDGESASPPDVFWDDGPAVGGCAATILGQ